MAVFSPISCTHSEFRFLTPDLKEQPVAGRRSKAQEFITRGPHSPFHDQSFSLVVPRYPSPIFYIPRNGIGHKWLAELVYDLYPQKNSAAWELQNEQMVLVVGTRSCPISWFRTTIIIGVIIVVVIICYYLLLFFIIYFYVYDDVCH